MQKVLLHQFHDAVYHAALLLAQHLHSLLQHLTQYNLLTEPCLVRQFLQACRLAYGWSKQELQTTCTLSGDPTQHRLLTAKIVGSMCQSCSATSRGDAQSGWPCRQTIKGRASRPYGDRLQAGCFRCCKEGGDPSRANWRMDQTSRMGAYPFGQLGKDGVCILIKGVPLQSIGKDILSVSGDALYKFLDGLVLVFGRLHAC